MVTAIVGIDTEASMTVFHATTWDADKADEALRKLCEAYEAGAANDAYMDGGRVAAALTLAVQAFPGLQEFVNGEVEADREPTDARINVTALPTSALGPVLDAACSLALVGAASEATGGFRWEDIDLNWELAKEAVAGSGSPSPR